MPVHVGTLPSWQGGYATAGKQLTFDVEQMFIGLGPWRWGIPLKKGQAPVSQRPQSWVHRGPSCLGDPRVRVF